MVSPERLYVTVALLALLAVSLTAIFCAWSIPSWRLRLARYQASSPDHELTGWLGHVGSGLVSAALAATASLAWWGFYAVLASLT